ncbi:YhgE/Pip domain-containing protein [Nonomuraea sp. NN258]|uniref:YhgE/Pip domain-containing protein n=1 Tax=Nonomuraea antri TaxID=2730852 RepID=UPI001567EBA0|nr:YhgE/Pip domain-containing protein [Nonomuraea antri]NRQ36613.1 YhgE/Pip domain-containing protein [Nonomuraea antri]
MRSMLRSRLTRAALAAVVVLPLLYAGLYLWSFWDPQGNLDRVPVALVMADRPATVSGKTLHAGQDLADELRERDVFDWHEATAREAADGVRDGSYYLALTVPADFSARLASPSDDAVTPTPAQLGLRVDTGRSYIIGSISDAVFNEVRAAAERTAIRDYFDKVFVSIGDIHDKTTEAADGAGKLRDGTVKAGDGVSRLNTGLGTAESGARQLTVGLNSANTATGKLHNGSRQVTDGVGQARKAIGTLRDGLGRLRTEGTSALRDGARQAADQVHAQTRTVNQLADKYVPVLNEWGPKVGDAADALAVAADRVADTAGQGADDGRAGRVIDSAQEAAGQAQAALDRLGPDADPQVREALRAAAAAARRTADQAGGLRDRVRGGGSDLPAQARELARSARRVAAVAPEIGSRVDRIRDQVNQLDAGLATLAQGAATVDKSLARAGGGAGKLYQAAAKLHDGSEQVTNGLGKLGGGLVKLGDGATRLHTGVDRLHDGAAQADKGLAKLAKGAEDLAGGLDEGADRIPDYDRAERDARSEVMSDPVRLAKSVDNEVPNYGTGFAPFFLPLALWVGAMIAYMVLKPLNQRRLAGTTGALRIALSGWLPALALGAAQVGVLVAVLRFALGLQAAHWAGVAGLLLLTAAAFMAVVQAVNALLGPPGRVVALALLMLQLTSAAGTYPIETSPGFFQTISPWLPMSWVVSALRRLISGGELTVVWQACGVLSAFLVLGLALTVLAVQRGRTWSMKRLHPELSL